MEKKIKEVKFGAQFSVNGRVYRKVTDNSVFKSVVIIAEVVNGWLAGMMMHFSDGDQLVELV